MEKRKGSRLSQLCLGTVQFGMKYGIYNKTGQPTEEECFEMLDMAISQGIKVIDTARAYGTAEERVGRYLSYRGWQGKIDVISKLCPNVMEEGEKDVYGVVRRELEGSLERLKVSKLKGYLLHTPEYIYQDKIVEALFRLKEEGLTENVGVSIYGMEEGYEAIKRGMDYVQLPYSVLDQRGKQTGWIEEAKKVGIKVFARSAFLQGLFLMDRSEVPEWLKRAEPYLEKIEGFFEEYRGKKTEMLLQFVKRTEGIDYLVFGVDNKEQLKENIESFEKGVEIEEELMKKLSAYCREVDDSIILPSLWSNGRKVE